MFNTTECFTNKRPSMPTSYVCLSTIGKVCKLINRGCFFQYFPKSDSQKIETNNLHLLFHGWLHTKTRFATILQALYQPCTFQKKIIQSGCIIWISIVGVLFDCVFLWFCLSVCFPLKEEETHMTSQFAKSRTKWLKTKTRLVTSVFY